MKLRYPLIACITFSFILATNVIAQTTRNVPQQYSTINAAISAAKDGDTIKITGVIKEVVIIISKSVIISGASTESSIIDGNTTPHSYHNRRIFIINQTASTWPHKYVKVTMQNLTIRNGQSINPNGLPFPRDWYSHGAAIYNHGELVLKNVNFINNQSGKSSGGMGGAILNENKLTIENCKFENNRSYNCHCYCFHGWPSNCPTWMEGGAIYNFATATIQNSVFLNNYASNGGAIYNQGSLNVSNCIFDSNENEAIRNLGNAIISNSFFRGNKGGTINNEESLTLNNCNFNGNEGVSLSNSGNAIISNTIFRSNNGSCGAILNEGTIKANNLLIEKNKGNTYGAGFYNSGYAEISNSTIDSNYCTNCKGSGIQNSGKMKISNTTIYYNRNDSVKNKVVSYGYGGGIYNDKILFLNNCSIAKNTVGDSNHGAGLFNKGELLMKNTIVSENENSDLVIASPGSLVSYGSNLVNAPINCQINLENDITQLSALLDTLRYNGGFTPTCALSAGSPALNKAAYYDIFENPVFQDQRGFYRILPNDIGAFENDANFLTSYQKNQYVCAGSIIKIMAVSLLDSTESKGKIISNITFSLDAAVKNHIKKAWLNQVDSSKKIYKIYGDTILSIKDTLIFNGIVLTNTGDNIFILHLLTSNNSPESTIIDVNFESIIIDSQLFNPIIKNPDGYGYVQRFPEIIKFSKDTYKCLNDNVSIFISAKDGYNQKYQWVKGKTKTTNKDSIFTITSLSKSYGAYYYCIVSNTCGNLKSSSIKIGISLPSQPVINFLNDTILCEGEQIKILSSSNYGNHWSNGDTSQSLLVDKAGVFSVYMTDSIGCISENSTALKIVVNPKPTKPIIDTLGKTEFCMGDSVRLTSLDKSKGYYWSNKEISREIKVDSSGTFKLKTINEYGCKSEWSDSVIVSGFSIPSKPIITSSGKTEFCDGDSVILTSTTFVTYYWDSGDSNQKIKVNKSGFFVLYGVDSNQCASPFSDTLYIKVNPNPSKPQIKTFGNSKFCEGDSVILFTSESYQYLWQNGDTTRYKVVKNTGSFSVQSVDSLGCKSAFSDVLETKMIPLPPKPFIILSGKDSLKCSEKADNYFWFQNNYAMTENAKSINTDVKGNYMVLIEKEGCISDSSAPYFFIPSDIDKITYIDNNLVFTYPNPVSDILFIKYKGSDSKDCNIYIADNSGKILLSSIITFEDENLNTIPVGSLKNGVYILNIVTPQGTFITKIVKSGS